MLIEPGAGPLGPPSSCRDSGTRGPRLAQRTFGTDVGPSVQPWPLPLNARSPATTPGPRGTRKEASCARSVTRGDTDLLQRPCSAERRQAPRGQNGAPGCTPAGAPGTQGRRTAVQPQRHERPALRGRRHRPPSPRPSPRGRAVSGLCPQAPGFARLPASVGPTVQWVTVEDDRGTRLFRREASQQGLCVCCGGHRGCCRRDVPAGGPDPGSEENGSICAC